MPFSNIDKPSKYFTAKLHTGTGSAQSITGLEFAPKFTWIKDRTSANNPRVYDIIRGATVELYPSLTDGDITQAQSLTSFNSDGFSVGTLAQVNTNGNNYVSWNWRGSDSSAVSNTSGTITSTVSANTTSGFSIVSYTANNSLNKTVGHGLGVAPKMILIKVRNNTADPTGFVVYHASNGANYSMNLHLTNAKVSNTTSFSNTSPTSTVFSVGDDGGNWGTNFSTYNYIAYCFAEVKGYSKFGSYTGNGNADGTFVYTGFKPAWIMVKGSSFAGDNWNIRDNQRTPINPANKNLLANDSRAEEPYYATDLLSNGFKARTSEAGHNSSGQTYIYMAFAENPFCSSKGIPTTAR